jgi:hypothetical protein
VVQRRATAPSSRVSEPGGIQTTKTNGGLISEEYIDLLPGPALTLARISATLSSFVMNLATGGSKRQI